MPRFEGDVFLLGTAISAPVPVQIQNNTNRIKPIRQHWQATPESLAEKPQAAG
jgi:hypothetical protein